MHFVSAKTRLTPYYIFSEFKKGYTEVCLNINLIYSNKLFHQMYCIKLLKKRLTE